MREALSARLDGEETGVAAARLDSHVAACAGCAAWLAHAEQVTRAVRLQPIQVPDLTAAVLAAVATDPGAAGRSAAGDPAHRSRRTVLRVALAVAAVVQVALALPVLAGEHLHLGREIASFEVAMAVGFALAAWRPERARGFVPVAAVLVAALAATSVIDVAAAQAAPAYETAHLVAVVQASLLWGLARVETRQRAVAGPAVAAA